MSHPFRIFISYSHEDGALAQVAADVLNGLGLTPVWDRHIRPGAPFTEAIKGLIHHAHIFMPIITEHASRRPWVHQETGYAMALSIPILPVAVDSVPGEMAAQLQAIVVRPDFADFADRLAKADLEWVVLGQKAPEFRNIEVTSFAEERAELLASCAQRVADFGSFGRVRPRGALLLLDPRSPADRSDLGRARRRGDAGPVSSQPAARRAPRPGTTSAQGGLRPHHRSCLQLRTQRAGSWPDAATHPAQIPGDHA